MAGMRCISSGAGFKGASGGPSASPSGVATVSGSLSSGESGESRGSGLESRFESDFPIPSPLFRLTPQVALNLCIECRRVPSIDRLVSVIVRRKPGDPSVHDRLLSHGFTRAGIRIGAVAIGLRLALASFPLNLVRVLRCVVFHWNLLLLGQITGHLLKLFDAGKLVDVFQPEAKQEVARRFVQNRPPDDLLAASGRDQLARHQTPQHTT